MSYYIVKAFKLFHLILNTILQTCHANFITLKGIHLHVFFFSFPALAVRFLTKRYIGEYDHQSGRLHEPKSMSRCIVKQLQPNLLKASLFHKFKESSMFSETRYKHEILVDGEPVLFEICDTCPKVSLLRNQTRVWNINREHENGL